MVLVANADRMMTFADTRRNGIQLMFADGCSGLIPFKDLPEIKKRSNLASIEIPNAYEVVLRTAEGQTVEIPWDFARHYCYPAYETRVRAVGARGTQSIGKRIRRLREAAGLTQQQLATSAGIGRVTLVRIEKGDQSPRYDTLLALARALKRPLSELLVSA